MIRNGARLPWSSWPRRTSAGRKPPGPTPRPGSRSASRGAGSRTSRAHGVFLSVDIDVCDPAHAPGTGTPEPGGLSARQLLDAVRRIGYELPVAGIDVVEVAPPYDHSDITSSLANRVVLEALSALARKRLDAAGGTPWEPGRPLLDGW